MKLPDEFSHSKIRNSTRERPKQNTWPKHMAITSKSKLDNKLKTSYNHRKKVKKQPGI